MPDKRRQYRVRSSPAHDLKVAVFRPASPPLPGKMVDLSAGGISISFPQRRDPRPCLREVLYLKIESGELGEPLLAPVLVSRRSDAPQGRVYGFEFLDWLGLLARLPPTLANLFNQRGEFRVKADPDAPIQVTVECEALESPIEAPLRDISAQGLSFSATARQEKLLSEVQQIKISLQLPQTREKLTFHGDIVHRSLAGATVCHGVCFDAQRTEDFPRKQNVLIQYVAERRRQTVARVSRALVETR